MMMFRPWLGVVVVVVVAVVVEVVGVVVMVVVVVVMASSRSLTVFHTIDVTAGLAASRSSCVALKATLSE